MAAEKTKAIVLKVIEFSETSCIATVYTREFGKQTLIAKGARRPKSPFEAALDVLAVCRIVFLQKSSGAMGIFTEAKLERRFRNRRNSLDWLYSAYYAIELLRTLVEEGDPHPDLFDLAESTIEALDSPLSGNSFPDAKDLQPRDASKLNAKNEFFELNNCLLRFETGLLKIVGHFPLLTHCVGCGRKRTINQPVSFALNAGGIVCPKCRTAQTNLIQVQPEALSEWIKLSREFDAKTKAGRNGELDRSMNKFGDLSAELREPPGQYFAGNGFDRPAVVAETRRLMNNFMSSIMGFEPKTVRFLETLSRSPAAVGN